MVAPEVARSSPGYLLGEREMLDGWLDYHRATLLWKCGGLTDDQLRERSCPPSTLSLLGLVRHMTDVENGWFSALLSEEGYRPRYSTNDDPDGDFDSLDNAPPDEVFAAYLDQCDRSRRLANGIPLDQTLPGPTKTYSLRWVYTHMVEEYARHNGHADLLRERIDGAVGD
jgi:uncharacterized damage-inducible protein DinB